jgi:hypothetical protein
MSGQLILIERRILDLVFDTVPMLFITESKVIGSQVYERMFYVVLVNASTNSLHPFEVYLVLHAFTYAFES